MTREEAEAEIDSERREGVGWADEWADGYYVSRDYLVNQRMALREAEARMRELEKRVKDLPPEFEDVIAKRFWDLFDAGGPRP